MEDLFARLKRIFYGTGPNMGAFAISHRKESRNGARRSQP